MKLSRPLLETDIAQSVRTYLESNGLTVRSEVPVVLPDHGRVTADLIGCKVDETGEWFTVVECKRRLDMELFHQAMRWRPFADFVIAAYMPSARMHEQMIRRIDDLDLHCVGRFIVQPPHFSIQPPHKLENPNTALIAAAFHSHDGSLDLPAGTAAGKRMTAARGEWDALRHYLLIGPAPMVDIHADLPQYRKYTARALRVLIDKGEAPGLAYEGHARTLFRRAT